MHLSTRQKILIAKTANRCVAVVRRVMGRPMRGEFARGGLRWNLDLDEGIDFSIYLLGSFEPDLVRYYRAQVRAGDTVLDIGANIGAHTLHFARMAGPRGRVIAVEPTNYALDKLRTNIGLNPALAPTIHVEQAFLCADEGATTVPEVSSSWPLTGQADDPVLVGARQHSTRGARSVTLDALVREMGLERVDWMKIDVDGHELDVLRGAREVLGRFHPRIIMELSPYCHPGTGFEELVGLLAAAGYAFLTIPGGAPLSNAPADLRRVIPDRGGINVLAVGR